MGGSNQEETRFIFSLTDHSTDLADSGTIVANDVSASHIFDGIQNSSYFLSSKEAQENQSRLAQSRSKHLVTGLSRGYDFVSGFFVRGFRTIDTSLRETMLKKTIRRGQERNGAHSTYFGNLSEQRATVEAGLRSLTVRPVVLSVSQNQ